MKKLLGVFAAAAAVGLAAPASATIIDFGAFATNNEGGIDYDTTIDFDGVEIRFRAFGGDPYFDGLSSGRPAGLGVCTTLSAAPVGGPGAGVLDADTVDLTGAVCVPSSDDNISSNGLDADQNPVSESVSLFFSEPFDVLTFEFRDRLHNLIDLNATLLFDAIVNGDKLSETYGYEWTFGELLNFAAMGNLIGTTVLWFGYGGDNASQFYLTSISDVPVPGALPLLISGLAGLGFASRRKKAKTA